MNLEKVFTFIKDKRGYDYPLRYKLINGLELTKDDLIVNGDLNLEKIKISSLPDNLRVNGSLYLNYSKELFSLPDNLHVTEDLSIEFSDISSIPNNLYVGGHFGARYTPLSEIYTKVELWDKIEAKGGYVGGGMTVWIPFM